VLSSVLHRGVGLNLIGFDDLVDEVGYSAVQVFNALPRCELDVPPLRSLGGPRVVVLVVSRRHLPRFLHCGTRQAFDTAHIGDYHCAWRGGIDSGHLQLRQSLSLAGC